MTHHGSNWSGWQLIVLVLGAIAVAAQLAFALEETYLRCKGSVAILYESGVQSVEKQEIAAHIVQGRVSFAGNNFLSGTDIEICSKRRVEK
jgi:hypothetical protein